MTRCSITEARRLELIAGRDVLSRALAGEVAVNIGQLEPEEIKALNAAVRAGSLRTWRGKWFPEAGMPFGMGPDKTCWGLPEIADFCAAVKRGAVSYVERGIPVEA